MKILYGICGSFCCHKDSVKTLEALCASGHSVTAIISPTASTYETRFGTAGSITSSAEYITGNPPLLTIPTVEKTVTGGGFDLMVICPCTGNTLGKLSNGITDTPVTMGAKAMLRNGKPVVIALATNDGLSASLGNIGSLMNRKNYYFVPLRQDDYINKPNSLVCNFALVEETMNSALAGNQLQPVFLPPLKKEAAK